MALDRHIFVCYDGGTTKQWSISIKVVQLVYTQLAAGQYRHGLRCRYNLNVMTGSKRNVTYPADHRWLDSVRFHRREYRPCLIRSGL